MYSSENNGNQNVQGDKFPARQNRNCWKVRVCKRRILRIPNVISYRGLAPRGAVLSWQEKDCIDKCSLMQFILSAQSSGRVSGRKVTPSCHSAEEENGQAVGEGKWAPLSCHRAVPRPNQTSTSPAPEGSCPCRWQSCSAWAVSWHNYSVKCLFVFVDGSYSLCALRASSSYGTGTYLNIIYCLNWSFACTKDV